MGHNEKTMDLIIFYILRTGVIIAGLLVVAGGSIWLLHFFNSVPHYRFFSSGTAHFPPLSELLKKALSFDGISLIQTGILVLIITPIFRVIFSFISFLTQKDAIYSLFTLIVILNLLFSFFGYK